MGRTRVADRLAAASNESTAIIRSDELDDLKEKFEVFIKGFKPFTISLKLFHSSLISVEQNRAEMLGYIESWTKGTPIFDITGKGNLPVEQHPLWAKNYQEKDTTFCMMQRQMSALNTEYAKQMEQYCVAYINDWEIVVTTRIRTSIKQAEDLKKDYTHYDKKVLSLVAAETKLLEKGKTNSASAIEKLKRNKEKLDTAKQTYDKYATSLCNLIDAALNLAWIEMVPLVYRLTNMELDRMGGPTDAQTMVDSLVDLVYKLDAMATEHNIETDMPDAEVRPLPPQAPKVIALIGESKASNNNTSTRKNNTPTTDIPNNNDNNNMQNNAQVKASDSQASNTIANDTSYETKTPPPAAKRGGSISTQNKLKTPHPKVSRASVAPVEQLEQKEEKVVAPPEVQPFEPKVTPAMTFEQKEPTVYKPVRLNGVVGSLILQETDVVFQPISSSKEITTIPWTNVEKHLTNPSKHTKALLKFALKEGEPITFQAKTRDALEEIHKDVTVRLLLKM